MLISALRQDLCLAYVNTRFWRGREASTETLHDLTGLVGWLERSTGAGAEGMRGVTGWSRAHPRKAARLFVEAIDLREAMFGLFAALATDKLVHEPDFAALKEALAQAPARRRLARSGGGYAWRIEPLAPSAPNLLAPVLWSAADLLIEGAHGGIRQCANDECLWLFLDASKNATRRWCDMASCGNRAKARRHYLKTRRK